MNPRLLFNLFLVFALGLFACQSVGVGPKQDSQITFDFVDGEGEALLEQKRFSLDQSSNTNVFSSQLQPTELGEDSIWVARIVNFDNDPLNAFDSLCYYNLSLTFYYKELKSLLVEDEDCKCFNYPDKETFEDRFWSDGTLLNENQQIIVIYTKSFGMSYLKVNEDPSSNITFNVVKQKNGAIYLKADFELTFGSSVYQSLFSNGEFQIEIPFK